MAINITQNFKNGGIRQGKVYIITETEGTFSATSLGRIKNPNITLEPIESDQDSQGRTSVIGFNVNATVSMMQHTHEEIQAAGELAYPADGTPEEQGYTILFTDGPLSADEVETLLNDTTPTIPGIMLENVFPKPSPNINFGPEDSAIEITINGVAPPDVLVDFATNPVISFAA